MISPVCLEENLLLCLIINLYNICLVSLKQHLFYAVSISPHSLPESPTHIPTPPGKIILVLDALHSLSVTAANIKQWTNRDPILSRVRNMIQQGWQFTPDADFKPYEGRTS